MSKHEFIAKVLDTAQQDIEHQITELLGQPFSFAPRQTPLAAAGEILPSELRQAVMVKMAVSGDKSGEAWVVFEVSDAIRLGGALVLLPEEELEERLAAGDFDAEVADALGEIGNIIAGAYTAIFEEHLSGKLHFKKEAALRFDPAAADSTLPAQCDCFGIRAGMSLAEQPLSAMTTLIPLTLLGMEKPAAAQGKSVVAGQQSSGAPQPKASVQSGQLSAADNTAADPAGPPLVLIVGEQQQLAQQVADLLGLPTAQVHCGSLQQDFAGLKGRRFGCAFLVMATVSDHSFAAAIKLRSAIGDATKLIMAAPQWTQKTVLQAVKYGACDILITPASGAELQEKLKRHLGATAVSA